jgi:hypothetical protein
MRNLSTTEIPQSTKERAEIFLRDLRGENQ